jgi:glycosyltransferase involved in cell wall biosynthesis
VDAGFFSLRRSIGVWLLEEVPVPDLGRVTGYLDELWTAPAAVSALEARTGTPTRPVPVPVHPARPSRRDGEFAVVTVATLGGPFAPGAAERANAIGALRAYARAFGPEDGATLVVRTSNGAQDVPALEELKLETDRADVSVVDGPLAAAERQALLAISSCYLSLARSTELDLPALEAMAAGTPVVATGAGLEVDDFVRVRSPAAPLPDAFRTALSGDEWLEPDLDDAARLLRRVRDEPARTEAGDSVRRLHSPERLEAFLAERLSTLLPTPTGGRARRALARILG